MKTLRKTELFLFVIVFGVVFPFYASANTISNTYSKAISNPHRFQYWLNQELANSNFAYYRHFEGCYQVGSGALDALERRVEAEYRTCSSDSECHETAKDVQLVRELRHNVNNLEKYISDAKDGNRRNYLDSEIGRAAVYINNLHKRLGIRLDRNPSFLRQLDILSNIPCQ